MPVISMGRSRRSRPCAASEFRPNDGQPLDPGPHHPAVRHCRQKHRDDDDPDDGDRARQQRLGVAQVGRRDGGADAAHERQQQQDQQQFGPDSPRPPLALPPRPEHRPQVLESNADGSTAMTTAAA